MPDEHGESIPNVATTRHDLRRHLIATSDCPDSLLESLWSDPDETLRDGIMLKQGDRTTIARLSFDERAFVIKRYNLKGLVHTIIHALMRSRARWSWVNGRRLQRVEIPTAAPVALLEERMGPFRMRSFLVMEYADGLPLADVIRDPSLTRARASRLADLMHAIWLQLGEHKIGHGDMKATNFLVDDADRIRLIDLDGMRFHPRGPTMGRARKRDLSRLMKNFDDPAVNAAARQAFRVRFGKS